MQRLLLTNDVMPRVLCVKYERRTMSKVEARGLRMFEKRQRVSVLGIASQFLDRSLDGQLRNRPSKIYFPAPVLTKAW